MKQEGRNGRRRRRVRYPLALGLVASALIHLLLALVNPGMVPPSSGPGGGTASAPGAQFTVLSISPRDDDDLVLVESLPRTTSSRTQPFGSPGAASDDVGASGRGSAAETAPGASVAERLRYNFRPFSAPVAPERESVNQRAIRETRERVRRAGEELGPLPPNGVARSRGGGGGISIPFGFKPPPPAITTPAPPPPDSILRRDSIRAAARAAFVRDSLRAARDTTKWRNVAPRRKIVIPRVVPDTTGPIARLRPGTSRAGITDLPASSRTRPPEDSSGRLPV